MIKNIIIRDTKIAIGLLELNFNQCESVDIIRKSNFCDQKSKEFKEVIKLLTNTM